MGNGGIFAGHEIAGGHRPEGNHRLIDAVVPLYPYGIGIGQHRKVLLRLSP